MNTRLPVQHPATGGSEQRFLEILAESQGQLWITTLTDRPSDVDPKNRVACRLGIMESHTEARAVVELSEIDRPGPRVGSIERGKSADFLILDRNLLEIPVDDISETEVLVTVFNGDIVYDKTGR